MMIDEFRKEHPEYDQVSTPELCEKLHRKHYAHIPKGEFDRMFIGRPGHDDLEGAAVRGKDSLELQDIDPSIKPAVKMTLKEFQAAQVAPEKPFLSPGNGTVYVFASGTAALESVIGSILAGSDSEALGYPAPGDHDCCVTRDGEVVEDLPTMRHHADKKNIIWAASGDREELINKAAAVSRAIQNKGRS